MLYVFYALYPVHLQFEVEHFQSLQWAYFDVGVQPLCEVAAVRACLLSVGLDDVVSGC